MGGAGSYSVAHRAGLPPTELTGMWGWILLRSPHRGSGSPPAPAPTKQRPGPLSGGGGLGRDGMPPPLSSWSCPVRSPNIVTEAAAHGLWTRPPPRPLLFRTDSLPCGSTRRRAIVLEAHLAGPFAPQFHACFRVLRLRLEDNPNTRNA